METASLLLCCANEIPNYPITKMWRPLETFFMLPGITAEGYFAVILKSLMASLLPLVIIFVKSHDLSA